MKKPKSPKEQGHKGITPQKAKRRPDTWIPSPVKGFNVYKKKG